MIGNKKYVKRGQVLIILDDPQRYEEVTDASRNKAGVPFRYAESLFAALVVAKSMTELLYRHLHRVLIGTLGDSASPCSVRNRQGLCT